MNEKVKLIDSRYNKILSFIIALLLILAIRLFVITMIQHESWIVKESAQNTKTIYTPAPRGNIYDRNGNLLAGNRQVFTAVFNASNLTTEEINDSSLRLIKQLESNSDEWIDDFPIILLEDGTFQYTYDNEKIDWLKRNGFSEDTSAKQVFESYKAKYRIADKLDRYDAIDVLNEKHNVYLPINIKTMQFTFDADLDAFWSRFGFAQSDRERGISAQECFEALRVAYSIDEELSDLDARNIFIVRNKIAKGNFQRYLPITVATNISDQSVIYLEENNLPGVTVSSQTERYYPYGATACHLIGYMGVISEGETEYYSEELGYMSTDFVGKDGIEAALEYELHGRAGIEEIIVNSSGDYVSTQSKIDASKGMDVYSTIQIELQIATEKALVKAIEGTEKAQSGAAVMLDVETGEVLAIASYPNFDLNTFADGISHSEWEAVQPKNPRDAFSPAPLFNNATMAAVAPGSTFKPLTSITALECGLNPNLEILDKGHIDLGGRSFGCYMWNTYGQTEGYQNLEWGLGNSCNYYMACIATGKDWGTGESLGYTKDITIDLILERANAYGLGRPTGIEIGETVRPPVSTDTKTEGYKNSLWVAIYEKSRIYFPPEVYNDEDRLYKNIDTITEWIYDNPSFQDLQALMRENTDVLDEQVEPCATMVKFDYFNFAEWTEFDFFNISIGQGDNAYTPIQIANYIATIGNDGMRNEVSVIYGVEGRGKTVRDEPYDTQTSIEHLEAVKKGMRRVCLSGTLSPSLRNYPVEVLGKTGTAQYQAIKHPDDEMEYIKSHLNDFNQAAGTDITWQQVEEKVQELMLSDANKYPNENMTVDTALIKLSDYKITMSLINRYKEVYDDFAWVVAMAPAQDPKVCVVIMLPEGGLASEVGEPVADMLTAYFDQSKQNGVTHVPTDQTGKNIWN